MSDALLLAAYGGVGLVVGCAWAKVQGVGSSMPYWRDEPVAADYALHGLAAVAVAIFWPLAAALALGYGLLWLMGRALA